VGQVLKITNRKISKEAKMNLESEIYRLSFELSEEFEENDLNKLLGVLASDGVYAMWVYAKDKLDWKFSKDVEEMKKMKCFRLLEIISNLSEFSSKKLDYNKVLKEIAKSTDNIDKLKEEIGKLKKSQNDKEINEEEKKKIKEEIKEREEEIKGEEKKRNQFLNKYFQDLAQDLNELLFMKELLEKVLIYAIYHAKAKGD
jgi:gas vesicle protein